MGTKFIKALGLILFVVGFGIFNGLFFLSDFSLSEEILKQHISDETKSSLFIQSDNGLIGKSFSSHVKFVDALKNVFEQINSTQLKKYGITPTEIEALKNNAGEAFDLSILEDVFSGNDAVSTFKKKSFGDYGNWLSGQKVTQQQLESVADNIKKYGIVRLAKWIKDEKSINRC